MVAIDNLPGPLGGGDVVVLVGAYLGTEGIGGAEVDLVELCVGLVGPGLLLAAVSLRVVILGTPGEGAGEWWDETVLAGKELGEPLPGPFKPGDMLEIGLLMGVFVGEAKEPEDVWLAEYPVGVLLFMPLLVAAVNFAVGEFVVCVEGWDAGTVGVGV